MNRVGAALILSSVLLAGCGSSSSSSGGGGSAGSTPPASSTTTVVTTTTTTAAGSSTTTIAAGGSACVAAELSVTFLEQQGATGHGLLGFALHNISGHACHTFGYPGIEFLDGSGRPLATVTQRTTHDFFGPAPERPLVLAGGATASFRVGVLHGVVPGQPCATAAALQVIAPDDTATLRVSIPGGAFECRTATVTPLQPGNSAIAPGSSSAQ